MVMYGLLHCLSRTMNDIEIILLESDKSRTKLRSALRLKCEGLSSFINENINLVPLEELNVCTEKVINLNRDIENVGYSNKDNEYKRVSTRLYYTQYRFKRISFREGDEQQHRNDLIDVVHK